MPSALNTPARTLAKVYSYRASLGWSYMRAGLRMQAETEWQRQGQRSPAKAKETAEVARLNYSTSTQSDVRDHDGQRAEASEETAPSDKTDAPQLQPSQWDVLKAGLSLCYTNEQQQAEKRASYPQTAGHCKRTIITTKLHVMRRLNHALGEPCQQLDD